MLEVEFPEVDARFELSNVTHQGVVFIRREVVLRVFLWKAAILQNPANNVQYI